MKVTTFPLMLVLATALELYRIAKEQLTTEPQKLPYQNDNLERYFANKNIRPPPQLILFAGKLRRIPIPRPATAFSRHKITARL